MMIENKSYFFFFFILLEFLNVNFIFLRWSRIGRGSIFFIFFFRGEQKVNEKN